MIKQSCILATGTLCALLLLGDNVFGITVELNPTKDNTLYESSTGHLSNGAGPDFFAGMNGQNDLTRGLLMFDIAAEVPSEATITNATLTLRATTPPSSEGTESIDLHRATMDWGEAGSVAVGGGGGGAGGGPAQSGDATWIHSFSPNTFWTNNGGDYSNIVSASRSVSAQGSYDWSSVQLTSDVRDMFDSPHNNFGWIVLGNEANNGSAKRFASKESDNPPILTIEFDLPNEFAADFDNDGDVDGDDLADWSGSYGSGNGGDADNDNDTDGADFLVWQQEFTGPAGLQSAVVPEPSSAALSLAMLALVALNHRLSVSHRQIG